MTTAELLRRMADLRVLIVGDICLDRWCTYQPALAEPSRETGLPRIAVTETSVTAGAAGTVANNLTTLGLRNVSMLGVVGVDGHGYELLRALASRGITTEIIVRSPEVSTFTYTKLINAESGREDLPRVDYVRSQPLPASVDAQLCEHLAMYGRMFDVVMVSDQAETACGGAVTPALREQLAALAEQSPPQVVWVDSRCRAHEFRGAVVKINDQEAALSLQATGDSDLDSLRRRVHAPLFLVTHGPEGVLVSDDGGTRWVRTAPVAQPVDICGAGDSFSAGAALTYAVTRSADEAARIGNLVASVTIMKPGTGTATPDEVLAAEAAQQP